MLKTIIKLLPFFFIYSSCAHAQNTQAHLDEQIQNALHLHYLQYKDAEYFSGAALSVYIPNQNIKNYFVGRVSQNSKSKAVDNNTLFQIGSLTKSFTAAIVLQLAQENKLKLTDSLKNWLPQYNKWSNITLNQLLNMTSGVPNYTQSPLMNSQVYYNLSRNWTNSDLIQFVYPPVDFNPPLKKGFYYSNTNYILASLIIEKAAVNSYQHELNVRLIQPAGLTNTFYILKRLNPKFQSRMAVGYFYDPYQLSALVGKDISESNLSFAAAAGGLISNSEDIVKWVKSLFIDNKILNQNQKNQLMSLVSMKDGKAIEQTSSTDPHGFGLGVAQTFEDDIGSFWYFNGKTIGYRAMFFYKPCNGVIISTVLNSATDDNNNHMGRLVKKIYQIILNQDPSLKCKEPL